MKTILKQSMLGIIMLLIMLLVPGGKMEAQAATYKLNITGSTSYYKVLDTILNNGNEARAAVGAPALVLDKELTEIAMMRAAELAAYYSHTRPNGTKYSTALPGYGDTAENIAMGQLTAYDAIQDWIASEGHYTNLINSKYVSTGIGRFYHNGMIYWVQLFSSKAATDTNVEKELTEKRTYAVEILDEHLNANAYIENDDNEVIYEEFVFGDQKTEHLKVILVGNNSKHAILDSFTWTSSNPAVLSIDAATGAMTVNGEGTVTITASQNGYSISRTVYCKASIADAQIEGVQEEYIYPGLTNVPQLTVIYNGILLTQDVDYRVGVGSNYVTITGIGNYTGSVTKNFQVVKYDAEDKAIITMANRPIREGEDVEEYLESVVTVTFMGKTLVPGTDYWIGRKPFYKSAEESSTGREYFSFDISYSVAYGSGYQNILTMGAYELNEIADQIHTGSAITPAISYGRGAGYSSWGLIDGDTVNVTYNNNVNVGKATVTVTGNGINYVGSISQTFRIVEKKATSSDDNVKVLFKGNGGSVSESSRSLEKAGAIGELPDAYRKGYTFKGWYTAKKGGKKVTAYTTVKDDLTLYARWTKVKVGKAVIKKLTKGSRRMKVTVKAVSGAKGYEIRYSLKSSMKNAKKASMTSKSTWIKKLKKNKRYYVQVRAYKKDSMGYKVYGKWSAKKSVKVK